MNDSIDWIRRDVELGPLTARYRHDPDTGRADLVLLPTTALDRVVPRRDVVRGVEIDAYAAAMQTEFVAERFDCLVQVKAQADSQPPAFAQGATMRNSGTVGNLRLEEFSIIRRTDEVSVRAVMRHADGWRAIHRLDWRVGCAWVEIRTCVENPTEQPVRLEMLASFSLAGLTPFAADDAPGRLVLHRFRSVWSMEGRLESRPVEELQLERSWAGWGVRCERFGTVGSLPVSRFFPVAGVEDTGAGVTWAARLACPGSWQMEAYRRDDGLAFSGGLADREFGHWWKDVAAGESFEAPPALVTSVLGGIDEACDVLVDAIPTPPPREQGLPIIVNEWATTWGRPTHDNMEKLAAVVSELDARYLVMDAGWFARDGVPWGNAHGDWEPCAGHYPQGLKATADAIRAAGLVPGLWFEFETCGEDSQVFSEREDLMLHRDGRPITAGARRFLDFRKPEVTERLTERVIAVLRDCGFGYLKVDYNETIGLGADGAESPGEGLREHLGGVQAFFRRIREELPDLVVENCSSGGHRLETTFFGLSEMSSFSDAHESREIPVIAANLNRLMSVAQSQVWVVLRQEEDRTRTIYSLAAGFLGRFCLSGDILHLNERQRALLHRALELYRDAEPVIEHGTSRRYGPEARAYRHAEGWQVVVRVSKTGDRALVVAHRLGGASQESVEAVLPPGDWEITDVLDDQANPAEVSAGRIALDLPEAWSAQVLSLRVRGG